MSETKKVIKPKFSFTQYFSGANSAQKEAIESDSALTVVAASAGTGKTYTLAQKVSYILSDKEKNVASDEILVLTFTIKAAQEMQERIKTTLAKWYNSKFDELAKSYGEQVAKSSLAYLKEKLDSLDDAYISNLHSFAKRVIAEGGLSLDLDPNATIIAEPQVSRWFSNLEEELSKGSIANFISLLPENPTNGEIARSEAEEFFNLKEDRVKEALQFYGVSSIANAVKLVGSELPSHGFTTKDLWNWQNPYCACQYVRKQKLLGVLHDWKNATYKYLTDFDGFEELEEKYFDQICLFDFARYAIGCENLESEEEFDDFAKQIEQLLAAREGASTIRKGSPAANLQQYLPQGTFAKWKNYYRDKIKPFCDLSNLPVEFEQKTFLERICAVLWQAYNSYKKENNLMELSELVQNAKKLFEREAKYAKKFKYIFVDEFQDTDPLQDSLINALWHKPKDENDVENHLFIVGDFKQSIYSFRGAEPTLLINYKDYALNENNKKLAKFIALSENYRTDCDLICNINDFFSQLWCAERQIGFVYGENDQLTFPFDKQRDARDDAKACNVLWCYGTESTTSISQLRSTRADAVAEDIIQRAQAKGENWSDFCVLVRNRSEFEHLETAFNKRKIPFVLCEAKNFFGKIETEDVVNYLALLDDNDNMTALAGWLMSPISAVGQAKAIEVLEAAEKRIKEYEKTGRQLSKKSLVLQEVFYELLPDVAKTLQNASCFAKIMGTSAAIEKLLENQEQLLKYVSENSRKRLLLNLMHIKEITREFEGCFTPSLSETVEYLEDSLNKNISREEPDLAELGSNAVTVMTIHASKGLEFDNVYLLLDKNDNAHKDTQRIIVSNKFGCLPSKYLLGGVESNTVSRQVSSELKKYDEDAEAERLVYVGFTRAKKTLTIAVTDKKFNPTEKTAENEKNEQEEPKSEIRKKIEDGTYSIIDELSIFHTYSSVERHNISPSDISFTILEEEKKTDVKGQELDLVTKMPKRLDKLTASAFSLYSWCPVAYRSSFRQGKTLEWHGENGEGSDFGTACHYVLRRWNFELDSLPLITCKFKQGDKIFDLLSSFAETKTFESLAALVSKGKVIREAPFDVEITYNKEKLHLVGVIDLLWQDEKGLHIRDWKTTEEENAPDGFYQKQLDFYALALNEYMKSIGEEVAIDAALIYLSSHQETNITMYKASELECIKQNVIDCSVACAGNVFNPQIDRCNSCPMADACMAKIQYKEK